MNQGESIEKCRSRFWRVVGPGAVPDVLGALEDPECQAGQKVSGRHQAGCRTKGEPGRFCNEIVIV
jgi:hypothetical protein